MKYLEIELFWFLVIYISDDRNLYNNRQNPTAFDGSPRSLWCCELRYHYNARRIKVAALLHIYLRVKYRVYRTTVMNILSEKVFLYSRKTYDSIFFKLDLSNKEYQYIAIQMKLPLVLSHVLCELDSYIFLIFVWYLACYSCTVLHTHNVHTQCTFTLIGQ